VIFNSELLTRVWGPQYRDDVQYLRVWVSRLRSKLEPRGGPRLIKTLHGIGYQLDIGSGAAEGDTGQPEDAEEGAQPAPSANPDAELAASC
jgi:DNA-binding winged helix-turn-helix (wHTH) protein